MNIVQILALFPLLCRLQFRKSNSIAPIANESFDLKAVQCNAAQYRRDERKKGEIDKERLKERNISRTEKVHQRVTTRKLFDHFKIFDDQSIAPPRFVVFIDKNTKI